MSTRNLGENLCSLYLGKYFLGQIQKNTNRKRKKLINWTSSLNLLKLKHSILLRNLKDEPNIEKIFAKYIYVIKNWYPEYIKNSQNTVTGTQTTQFLKEGTRFE